MAVTRADVVAAARTWIGTPYHHQARVKGVGVDCIGLVICVGRELGLADAGFDIQGYSRDPDSVSAMAMAQQHMTRIERDAAQPGDVMVITFDRDPQHFCILGDYRHGGLSIIHAVGNTTPARVIEQRLMFSRALRFAAAFSLPGIANA